MIKNLNYYRLKFAPKSKENPKGLNVSRSSGVAPNKPVLLLAVIELISQGEILTNAIYLSPELIATFLKLWKELEINRNPDIGLPFYHLRSDGFWYYKPKPGFEALIRANVKIRTPSTIRETVQYAYLDDELFELLQNPDSRNQLTQVLIDSWFADKTTQIEQSFQVNAFQEFQDSLRSSGGKVYQPEELEDEQIVIVRDAAFRRNVVSLYEYRCAFCGLHILDPLGFNIVDGAHIKPFAEFRDDLFNNGISLCKNHHWAFDRFWFTIADDYSIIVADSLREISPHARPMREFQGERLLVLPDREHYRPRLDSLQWHRQAFIKANPSN